ncbi:cGMP-dependent 3',5'-cGMP phosphodiesterase [Achlya hypogyna]|uniref:cGMP-dependent 3',5'-cGMP phosphodiesterase n=1 Tax=Achlya hypogyna TaxID=1202772 RepID=A0A1V9ZS88_ACHHY|nr:cGMP-dependent 3',5'-cGMP phosphodiesterase [Achlya hypogyna]
MSTDEGAKATLKVTDLPRGGTIVSTSIGPIQYGIPPETIKDSMALGLPVPMYFIVPSEPFTKTLGSNMGVNVAEFEFPAYCNFFFKRQCVNLIVASQEVEDRIRRVFQETLFGPATIDTKMDFPHQVPAELHPNLPAELGYFRKFGNTLITLEMLLKFTHFNDNGVATLVSGDSKVAIQKTEHGFVVTDTNGASVLVEDYVRLPTPAQIQTVRDVFYPPEFGVTVLGNSHGFDPNGKTSGYVLWINHRGIMVDPPPFSTSILIANSIPPLMIDGVIILQEGRVSLITTQTIYHSFLRKYAALSGFEEDFLKRVLNYRMVRINDPTSIRGATFRFFYSLHSIPCVGFEVTYGSKRIVFSGDHLNDVERIKSLRDEGVLSETRCNELLAFPWDCDVILHEAGVPPIHTPMKTLMSLDESIRQKIYVVHTAAKDIPADSGLRAAPEGVQNTIIVPTERPESASTLEVLDLVRKIDIFVDLTLSDAYELIQMARRHTYSKSTTVQEAGAAAGTFYIIIAGEAQAIFPSGSRTDTCDRKRLSTVPKSKRYIPGDYFDLQYLLTPNMAAGYSVIASSTLSLLEFNAADINWFLRGTTVFGRIQKLVETRHSFAWDSIAENGIFVKLTEMQRTQLELTLFKWTVDENFVIWNADEACDIAVFVADGEFVMKTWNKVTPPTVDTVTEPRGLPRKRKGSVNRVVPIDSVTSGPTNECLHSVFKRGAFIGNVDALTSNDDCAFGTMLVAKSAGTLFCVTKADFKFFLFENPGLLMALSGKNSVI